jgi:hypothetical protein
LEVSPDHTMLAYAVDFNGSVTLTLTLTRNPKTPKPQNPRG